MAKHAANRLARETSPYLLQHANNPVDWYAWGPEALERAKQEDKPIFLSIGYSACHWCHVMERESFEDEAVAAALNDGFVSIKVDREERPDLDALYMTATVAMSGGGGWPMSVFLAPDGRPFFAGTYFPKTSRYGKPGFLDVLGRIRQLWKTEREGLLSQADELVSAVAAESASDPPRAIDAGVEADAAAQLLKTFDAEWGGFGGAPKFPAPGSISLLLRHFRRTADERALEAALTTLDRMARGGIYDHVGGGFARYSTDERWHVPHFEKMLYDNAQLARVYVEAWQVTGEPRFAAVARDTLDYVLREMVGEHGAYFSATDADSEGIEGKFFVWDKDELERLLPPEQAEAIIAAYDVRPRGNWEGHNVLWMPLSLEDVAAELGVSRRVLDERLSLARTALYDARKRRVPPLCDDKVLVSWNALMIGAMAFAGRALREPRYIASAERAAAMIQGTMWKEGRLLRTYREGRAHIDGFLEDHAFLADALVDLYEATGARAHLDEALRIAERAAVDFTDDDGDAFTTTARHHEALVVRTREATDNATPSANAVLARALARLGGHLDRGDLRATATRALRAHGRAIAKAPRAFATSLDAMSRLIEPPIEIALVGTPGASDLEAIEAIVGRSFLPNAILATIDPGSPSPLPLASGKVALDGKATAYVCRAFACQAPVTSPGELAAELAHAGIRARAERARALDVERIAGGATAEATARLAGERADAPLGSLLGARVHRAGVLVASYSEGEIVPLVEGAVQRGRNLIAFDAQRASALGDALGPLVRAGKIAREALFLVGIVPSAASEAEGVELARRMLADSGLERVDALVVPWAPPGDAVTRALDAISALGLATHTGVAVESLDLATAEALRALPASIALVAAPLNLLEGDASLAAQLGRAFLALRPLDARANIAGGARGLSLADSVGVDDLPDAPAFASALAALAQLESEYRKTVAVHLRVQGDTQLDPNELLLWSEELRRAEQAIDDLGEAEAFVAQSVSPALRAQFAALAGLGGPLGPVVASLRDRYLEALDRALKALAREVVGRQATLTQTLAHAVGADPETLAAVGLGAVLGVSGVTAALVTCRTPAHVEASERLAPVVASAFERARTAFTSKS
jgi:uncharacterized protein YyaL (SSP411 family)